MWRDLIRKDRLRSILLLALYLALTMLAQNTLFARLKIWGVFVCIMPALMMAVAMFRGPIWAGVFGIFAGFFADMAYPESTVFFLVLLPLLGYFGGILAEHLMNQDLIAFLCMCFVALLFTAFAQILRLWVFHGAALGPMLLTGLKQAVVTLPFAIPFYFISKAVNRRERPV